MNEINCIFTRPLRLLRRPEASRNADPGPGQPGAQRPAIQPPRKCTEPMLSTHICQWRNVLGRPCGHPGRMRFRDRQGRAVVPEVIQSMQ